MAGFKEGKTTLNRLEMEELGNVNGKSLFHLQCHFGLDTLSFARLGAEVTGVDFSTEAISHARRLNDEVGLNAMFIHSDIYDLPDSLDGKFDIVFTSYGVLCWLPNMPGWGQTIARCLKPGGVFYLVDSHPFLGVFEMGEPASDFQIVLSYFHKSEPFEFQGEGTYASPSDGTVYTTYEWAHGLGDTVNALISSGLQIEFIHEFPHMQWQAFPFLEQDGEGLWRLPDDRPQIPLTFSVRAHKT